MSTPPPFFFVKINRKVSNQGVRHMWRCEIHFSTHAQHDWLDPSDVIRSAVTTSRDRAEPSSSILGAT